MPTNWHAKVALGAFGCEINWQQQDNSNNINLSQPFDFNCYRKLVSTYHFHSRKLNKVQYAHFIGRRIVLINSEAENSKRSCQGIFEFSALELINTILHPITWLYCTYFNFWDWKWKVDTSSDRPKIRFGRTFWQTLGSELSDKEITEIETFRNFKN